MILSGVPLTGGTPVVYKWEEKLCILMHTLTSGVM